MGLDYYNILEVKKKATDDDVKNSYRRLALKWHPTKNPNNKKEAQAIFKQISEAYEVLSNPQLRAIYEQYGEEGLKDMPPKGFTPRNAEDIFAEFFASSSPFGSRSSRPLRSSRSDNNCFPYDWISYIICESCMEACCCACLY